MKKFFLLVVFLSTGFAFSQVNLNCQVDYHPNSSQWYRDADNDGYGNPQIATCSINQPAGYVSNYSDCNDSNPNLPTNNYWRDQDGDGFGDPNIKGRFLTCNLPNGYVYNNNDCNDGNASVYPGAPEVCDGVDNDCDGQIDENTVTKPSGVTVTSSGCGQVTLSHNGPSTWYWQTTSTGTSTLDNANPKVVSSGSTLFLKAKSGNCWSDALQVNFSTAQPTLVQPSIIGSTSRCGNGTLSVSAVYMNQDGKVATAMRWYNSSGTFIGETAPGANKSFNLTQPSQTFKVAAVVDYCVSPQRTFTLTVNPLPSTPQVSIVEACGSTSISMLNPPSSGSNIQWYWQSSAQGTDVTSQSTTLILNQPGTVYLRAKNQSTGCWSSTLTIPYTVDEIPATPSTTVDKLTECDSVILIRNSNPPTGVIWYWQSQEFGTDTSSANSQVSIELTSGTMYYLRAYKNGCWSDNSLKVFYSIPTDNIVAPVVPAVNICGAGDILLFPQYNGLKGPETQVSFNFYTASGTFIEEVPYNGSFSATIATTTTYQVKSLVNGCEGSATSVTATVTVPNNTYYADFDGDGLGDPYAPSVTDCQAPVDYVSNNNDLCPEIYDPTNACVNPINIDIAHNPDNYIYKRTYQTEKTLQNRPTFFSQSTDVVQEITYFDGLGRARQSIGIDQTPNGNDLITHVEYDSYNRTSKEWLPYPESVGSLASYRDDSKNATLSWYQLNFPDDISSTLPNPFSQKYYEPTPLNRVLKQGAPGEDWQVNAGGSDNAIEMGYQTNAANEVRKFEATTSLSGQTFLASLTLNGHYPAGTLTKNIVYDENHPGSQALLHSTEEFTDKQGRVVLKRTYALVNSVVTEHDTYYVYDDYGNLTYVLPPKMDASSASLTNIQNQLDELGYQYVYDQRNRLVEKKIPGKGLEYIVYNSLDQPILVQDAIQRTSNEWLFTKYDAFGRVAYTGKAVLVGSRASIQSTVTNLPGSFVLWANRTTGSNTNTIGGKSINYSETGYPGTADITELLTVNYYDDYNIASADLGMAPTSATVFGVATDNRTKGLATVSLVRVLTTNHWISTVTLYDDKARAIYTHTNNPYLATKDIVETQLDFAGKPLKVKSGHYRLTDQVITFDRYTYDHAGRLLIHTQCIGSDVECVDSTNGGFGGAGELIAYNQYDELGQLVQKKVGGSLGTNYANTNSLQTVDYTYNVRGWLKKINDPATLGSDLFAFGINYNDPVNYGATENPSPLFNGNISQVIWKTASTNTTGNAVSERYSFAYDALNRITAATDNTGHYNLSNLSYDKNGNIASLVRDGQLSTNPTSNSFGIMDNLVYSYQNNSNKLMKVTDSALDDQYGFKDDAVNSAADGTDDYEYDVNGNLTKDENKEITDIDYNHLNLPTNIVTSSGTISYVYDATGTKLKKTVSVGSSVTLYAGNFVYTGPSGSETLQFFNHPEGYATPDGLDGYDYVYQYKDHLGNVRLSYVDNGGTLEIVEENNYYPFGLKHNGYNIGTSPLGNDVAQKWKFGGKEFDDSFDINTYDFGARNYDPALGRWMNLDPLAEQMRRHSPYNYAFDNPVFFIDPDGMKPRSSIIQWSDTPGPDDDNDDEQEESISNYNFDDIWNLKKESGNNLEIDPRDKKKKKNKDEEIKKNAESLDKAMSELTQLGLEKSGELVDKVYWVGVTKKGKLIFHDRSNFGGNRFTTDLKLFKRLNIIGFLVTTTVDAASLGPNPSAQQKLDFKLDTALGAYGLSHPAVGTGILIHTVGKAVTDYVIEHPKTISFGRRLLNAFDKWIYELEHQY